MSTITEHESLTDAVLRYKRSGEGFSELLERIGTRVYRYPKLHKGWTEDDCADFFCYFYPKILRILNRFQYSGQEFDAYLTTCVRWQLKSFASIKAKQHAKRKTLQYEEIWRTESSVETELAVSESATEDRYAAKTFNLDRNGMIVDPVMRKRILLLILKSSQELDSNMLTRAARLIGCLPSWLEGKVTELHENLDQRRHRRDTYRARRDRAFFRIHYLESKLGIENNPSERTRLRHVIVGERKHLTNARHALSRVPVAPTHQEIANALSIPKGSVDSALYYLKRTFGPKE